MIRFLTRMKLPRIAAAVLALSLAGCSASAVPARVSLEGKRILVIPFGEGDRRPFSSDLGRQLALGVSAVIASDPPKKCILLDFRDAERLAKDPEVDWRALGAAAKADYLVLGSVREYRLREPKDLTTRRGTLVVEYRVLDVATGGNALLVPQRTFHFPPDHSQHEQSFNFGGDVFTQPEEIANGLLKEASIGIAEDFLEHEPTP